MQLNHLWNVWMKHIRDDMLLSLAVGVTGAHKVHLVKLKGVVDVIILASYLPPTINTRINMIILQPVGWYLLSLHSEVLSTTHDEEHLASNTGDARLIACVAVRINKL